MSGALAPEDVGTTRLKPPSSKTRATLQRIAREADHAQATKLAEGRRSAQPEPEQIPSSFPEESAQVTVHTESAQSPIRQQSHTISMSKRLETPRLQASMLKGATFKKRSRQPSLLQIVQSQNQVQHESDDDDMYNFLPDDESTPLIKSLSQSHAGPRSSSSQQTSGSRKRKQTTPEIQVPASQSLPNNLPSSPLSLLSPPSEPATVSDLPAEEDLEQPTLPPLRSTRTPPPQIYSDTLAPPQSSSPVKAQARGTRKKPPKASKQSKPKAQKMSRKEPSPGPSPMSSTSALQSPVRPKPLKPLTTATLQNLLPRRRVRGKPKGDFDIPSSSDVELDGIGIDEDEDELSFHTTKMCRKRPSMAGQKSLIKRKENLGKKASKIYTRKSIVLSDDESEDDENASGSEGRENVEVGRKKTVGLGGKASEEMKRLAEKFKEVDDFTLEFEDMTGSSSQMKDAR